MYRCQICGCAVGPRVPSVRLVVETRPVKHPYRPKSKKTWVFQKGKWEYDWQPDYGGQGSEIVREVVACLACAPAVSIV